MHQVGIMIDMLEQLFPRAISACLHLISFPEYLHSNRLHSPLYTASIPHHYNSTHFGKQIHLVIFPPSQWIPRFHSASLPYGDRIWDRLMGELEGDEPGLNEVGS